MRFALLTLLMAAAACASTAAPLPPAPIPSPAPAEVPPDPPSIPKQTEVDEPPATAWPWRDGDKVRVRLVSRGARALNTRKQSWDMALDAVWTFSATTGGGLRVVQETSGDWMGKAPPPDVNVGRAHYLGISRQIELGPDGKVISVESVADARQKMERRAAELAALDHISANRIDRVFGPDELKMTWMKLLHGIPRLGAHLGGHAFERSTTGSTRFPISGDRTVRVAIGIRAGKERCGEGADECWRIERVAQANPDDLRAGYLERTRRTTLMHAARQMKAWLVVRSADSSLLEAGTSDSSTEQFAPADKLPEVLSTVDSELSIRFDLPPR